MQDTRLILRDMDHLSEQAAWWPSDRRRRWGPVQRWWDSRGARSFADFTEVNQITRDVWDWLRSVEALSDDQRRDLADRGIDVQRLRETLLADRDFHERFVAIVHRLRMYERALVAGPTDPFRGNGHAQHRGAKRPGPSVLPRPTSGDDEGESETPRSEYARVLAVYGPALRRKAARHARSPADVEDLYQDMLVAIWRALPQFKGLSSLRTYVHRIAYSTAVDYIRKYRDVGPEVELEAAGGDPEARLVELRARERLREEVARLPERLREVVLLWLEGHDYAAIADGVGIQEGNVGARLTRARARLRRRLAKA